MLNKIISIYKAFFVGADINKDVHKNRIETCLSCDYVSNKHTTNTFDYIRVKLFKQPFCTICKCQIYEKTSQGREVCALLEYKHSIGLWNRIYVKFNGNKKMNVISLSPNKINIGYNREMYNYKIDNIHIKSTDKQFKFDIRLDFNGKDFKRIEKISNSCGVCIKSSIISIGKNHVDINTRVLNSDSIGEHTKRIYIKYRTTSGNIVEEDIEVVYNIKK